MKKIILFMAMLALTLGSGFASADKVYIPLSFHFGSSDYQEVEITNLASQPVRVSVKFNGAIETGASSMNTNTLSGNTSETVVLGSLNTWRILTKESNLLGTTTSLKRAVVVVQSSASNDPAVGSIGANAFFIHVSSSGAPSGFVFPTAYQAKSEIWNSSNTGLVVGGTTVTSWKQ